MCVYVRARARSCVRVCVCLCVCVCVFSYVYSYMCVYVCVCVCVCVSVCLFAKSEVTNRPISTKLSTIGVSCFVRFYFKRCQFKDDFIASNTSKQNVELPWLQFRNNYLLTHNKNSCTYSKARFVIQFQRSKLSLFFQNGRNKDLSFNCRKKGAYKTNISKHVCFDPLITAKDTFSEEPSNQIRAKVGRNDTFKVFRFKNKNEAHICIAVDVLIYYMRSNYT